jgi:hypothetical protein
LDRFHEDYQHENITEIVQGKSNDQQNNKTINDFEYKKPGPLQSYIAKLRSLIVLMCFSQRPHTWTSKDVVHKNEVGGSSIMWVFPLVIAERDMPGIEPWATRLVHQRSDHWA